jgi:SEC-C motif
MPQSPNPVFFLYLRSFASELATTENWKLTGSDGKLVNMLSGSPKAALEVLLEPAGPLIEVGGRQHLGVGQVNVSDEKWLASAIGLMIHSTAIFLNPGTTGALTTETRFILKNKKLMRRTFLIMEPTHKTMLSAGYPQDQTAAQDRQNRWAEIANFFRREQVDLPGYDPRGAIISLLAPEHREKFTGVSRYQLYDLLHRLYVDLTKRGSYDLVATERCPCGSNLAYAECHGKPPSEQPEPDRKPPILSRLLGSLGW